MKKSTSTGHGKQSQPDNGALYARLKKGEYTHDILKKSAVIASLIKKGETIPQIAKNADMSVAHVYNYDKLNSMPVKIKTYIKEGRLGVTDALALARKQPNKKAFLENVEKFIKLKESSKLPFADTMINRKEAVFNKQHMAIKERSKLRQELEKVINRYFPSKISKNKLEWATNQFLNGLI